MIFLDTSFLAALFMKNDQWHERAQEWARRARPPFVTTEYVLIELADGLARPAWRPTFLRIHEALRKSADVQIVAQSPERFVSGLELYRSRADKAWSLTDCLSFTVMQERGCTEALSSDVHFIQAGFRALLLEAT
ncbi:MAG: hypothetical protein BroJett003_17680 [Planctomycetota bacterium]|nr:MAG: hypothetical protein BroJett003_17680 [Planctomycetota bacterium]